MAQDQTLQLVRINFVAFGTMLLTAGDWAVSVVWRPCNRENPNPEAAEFIAERFQITCPALNNKTVPLAPLALNNKTVPLAPLRS
jgi:hypothetical protein